MVQLHSQSTRGISFHSFSFWFSLLLTILAPGIQENLGSQENSSQSTSLTQGKEISQTINYEATHIFKNCLEATKKKHQAVAA